jgi:phosphatidylserine decarboxylase
MTIHKEGIPSLILVFSIAIVLQFLSALVFNNHPAANFFAWAIGIFLIVLMLQFFRKPSRKFNLDENILVSPCDGKVVVIEEVEETEYFKDKRIQVSIFMSPINVHINWNPFNGTYKYVKYHPGKFLMAFNPKSSTENERSSIVIEDKNGNAVLFRQIAGFLARRIVYYAKEGEKAEKGKEFGFIKFGSRVDLFFPIGTKIDLKIGDVVKGGITPITKFNS